MNERILSRRLSTSVVDALKSHGHILVVKGGATALARELDELMAPRLATIEPRIKPRAPMGSEPTSTFGDEAVDEAVEDMVAHLTRALMDSDHVEDVFAEDNVIRRDIFRIVRDGLLQPPGAVDPEADDHPTVKVRLDTLGYVAATVSKRADPRALRQALDRAASVAQARFSGFSVELREATFRLDGGGGPDERLELEEAVADELAELVEQGLVELPTVERRIDLGRSLSASEQRALRGRIDAAADATLPRSGCAASWEFADVRTLLITFTPLSDQDGAGVDPATSAFARDVAGLLSAEAKPRADEEQKPPRSTKPVAGPASARAKAPVEVPEEEPEEEAEPAEPIDEIETPSKRARSAPAEAAGPASATPKRAAAKKAAPKRATEAEPASRGSRGPASARKVEGAAPNSAKPAKSPAKRTSAATAKTHKAPAKKR